jgi:hypothetical protein
MSLTGRICYIEKSLEQSVRNRREGRSEVPYKWRKRMATIYRIYPSVGIARIGNSDTAYF